jgi:hypothetical protein
VVKPAPQGAEAATKPAAAADGEHRALDCAAVTPPLSARETYVYAGVMSLILPERRRSDGTVRPVRQAAGDGNYEVITLEPDGRANALFFTVRAGSASEFSETDSACWQWNGDGAAPRDLVVMLGERTLEFARDERQLRQRVRDDKLGAARVFDRVDSLPAGVACASGEDALGLFVNRAAEERVAFVASTARGFRAVVLARGGEAVVIEVGLRGSELEWNAGVVCWAATREGLRVTRDGGAEERFVPDPAGMRRVGDAASASAYLRAK